MASPHWITFLTDYGLENKFIGTCRGVMARIAPDARTLDITHLVPRGDVRHGAEILRQAIGYLPPAVHLAVVDPGVGTSVPPVLLLAGEHLFVGPDNGLLPRAADHLGRIDAAYRLDEPRFQLHPISHTFHGRDIFAPAAAHLATGVPPAEFGPAIPIGDLWRIPDPVRSKDDTGFHGEIVIEDRFGNLQTSLDSAFLRADGITVGTKLELTCGSTTATIPFVETFGSVAEGEPLAHIDSADRLAVAVNLGSAAETFTIHEGNTITLTQR